MKMVSKEEFEAMEAARRASGATEVKKYSTLKIIRALGDEWQNYRARLEAAGYLDQFFAANYLASTDPVFQAFLATVPDEVKAQLENCLWEAE